MVLYYVSSTLSVGFRAAKKAVVTALREMGFQHDAREVLSEKNLLALGDIGAEDVAKLILRTMAADYTESPHHADHSVVVHTFRPTVNQKRWYIKVYFLDEAEGTATFISVHRAGS